MSNFEYIQYLLDIIDKQNKIIKEQNEILYMNGIDVLDKRNRRLYTNDIVLYRVSNKPFLRTGFVVFEQNSKEFGIIDQKTYHFTPFFLDELSLFDHDRLEVISHLFTVKEKSNEF